MNQYETIIIADPRTKETKIKTVVKKIKQLIKSNGSVKECSLWGMRKLAYPISTKTGLVNDGYYIHMDFISSKEFITELNKSYEATDEILKHIIVLIDEEV